MQISILLTPLPPSTGLTRIAVNVNTITPFSPHTASSTNKPLPPGEKSSSSSSIKNEIKVYGQFVDDYNSGWGNLDALVNRILPPPSDYTTSSDATPTTITISIASTLPSTSAPSSLTSYLSSLFEPYPSSSYSLTPTPTALINSLKSNDASSQFLDHTLSTLLGGESSPSFILYRSGKLFESSTALASEYDKVRQTSSLSLSLLLKESPCLFDLDESKSSFTITQQSIKSHLRLDRTAAASINLLPPPSTSTQVNQTSNQYTSIYGLLDRCKTKMGKSLLNTWLRQPLVDKAAIERRLDLVEFFTRNSNSMKRIRDTSLKGLSDLNGCVNKLERGGGLDKSTGQMRGGGGLKELYEMYVFANELPLLIENLEGCDVDVDVDVDVDGDVGPSKSESDGALPHSRFVTELKTVAEQLAQLKSLAETVIDMSLAPRDYVVNAEFDEELIEIKNNQVENQEMLDAEHERIDELWSSVSGKPLNSVRLEQSKGSGDGGGGGGGKDGVHFRIPNSADEPTLRVEMKDDVQIVSILKNGVYFVTTESRRLETNLMQLRAEYKSAMKGVVENAMSVARTYTPVIERSIAVISELDVVLSFAEVAFNSTAGYCRPTLTDIDPTSPEGKNAGIFLEDARHPCVEMQDNVEFIPNSYTMSYTSSNFHIITGPNMGGKSTYIRGLGAIVAMAQVGSFVPCSSATINIVDSILCRVGAGDAQAKGISTFMAEMLEASSILQVATSRSLIIIDELGRGTSTFDGFGLAWAISEYIVKDVKCCTVFATHFHELTALSEQESSVSNFHVSAQQQGQGQGQGGGSSESADGLIFLYKVAPGPCLQSFGIQVAEMANIPISVINEAKRKAKELENFDFKTKKARADKSKHEAKMFLSKFKEIDAEGGGDLVEIVRGLISSSNSSSGE